MKRVYCLYRVSTKGQVDKDDIPMQRLKCNEFAKAQGWTILKEFSEKGVSGFKVSSEDRDAIQDIKAAAVNKEFDVLLVFMFDRLGRREDETPFVVEWFVKQGVEVWSTQEGEQRFETHVDKLMNYIRFWQASGESIKTSLRIKTRMQQLVLEGKYTGGVVPYGYKKVKSGEKNKKGRELYKLEVEPEEAEIIQMIFEKTIKEGLGSHRLAGILNNMGLKTHNGSDFQSNTVNRILKNRLYCGYFVSNGTVSPHIKELQIVDQNVFDNVQNIVKQRIVKNAERTIPLNTKGKTLLSGNIFCAHCGGRLVVTRYQDCYIRKDGSEYRVDQLKYSCYHRSRKLNDCDGQTSYIAEKIDSVTFSILSDLFKRIKETPKDQALEKRYKLQVTVCHSKYKKISAELDKLNTQLKSLKMEIGKSLTGESLFTAEQISEAISATQGRINVETKEQERLKEELDSKKESMEKLDYYYNQFLDWANEFQNATLEQQKMIASGLIRRVKVSKGYKVNVELDMNYQQFCEGL